jgi:hypothetical protein
MTEPTVLLLVVVGGAAGLAIVGVALYVMRQERPADSGPAADSQPATGTPPAEVTAGGPPVDMASAAASPIAADSGPPAAAFVPEDISVEYSPPASVKPMPMLDSIPAAPAPPAALDAPASPAPPAAAGEAPGPLVEQEVLRLWRSPTGRMSVEVNGKRFRSREEIGDYGTAQLILNAAKQLNQFLSLTPSGPVRKIDTERPVVKVSLEEAATKPVQLPTMDIMKQMRYLREQSKKPELQIKSIMDEINDILQDSIARTSLAGRGLKVADGLNGGIFSLDGHDYETLDQLPDPDAREAVRAAIQEWDSKR